jgi:hypothetical protein
VATTYILRDTNSGLATPTGGRFYKELLTATGAAGSVTSGSIAGGLTVVGYAFTDVGVPGAVGAIAGEFIVEMNVTVSSTTCNIQVAVAQVDSTGAVKNITAFTAAQGATVGMHTFFRTTPTWTWAAGDRLRVTYQYVRTSTMGNETVTISANTTDAEVTAPWTIIPSFTGTLNVTQASDTLAASGTVAAGGTTGTVNVAQAAQTLAASGTSTAPAFTGTLAVTQATQTLAASGGPVQILRPDETISAGSWEPVGAATIHEALAVTSPSPTIYARSSNDPNNDPAVCRLPPLVQPVPLGTGDVIVHIVDYDKEGLATASLIAELWQNYNGGAGTLLGTMTDSNVADAAENGTVTADSLDITYTGGAASNLDVRITADVT